jgi:Cu(I)/Ag(I) efflux system membrane protein CusA/SilA
VGWIYQYALMDRSGTQDAGQLRALQDWFLKYELKTVPNVAEVASVGGMVRQYQIVLDPDKLAAYAIPHSKVVEAIQKANQEAGGSVLELGEAEYMVRASGYLQSLEDFRSVPLATLHLAAYRSAGRCRAYPDRARKCAAASANWTAKVKPPAA